MNPIRLANRIEEDEGFRSHPYQDTEGVWTYGFGSTTDPDGNPVHENTPPILEYVARRLLWADIFGAWQDAWIVFPRLSELGPVEQEVLVNMAYNLGRARLMGFKKLRMAVNVADTDWAADEMVDSRWFQQVGHRAVRLAREMRSGKLAGE